MISVRMNSETIRVEDSSSLAELLEKQGYVGAHLAVALNGCFIPKSLYQTTLIQHHDVIEIVSPMQGG